MPPRNFGQGAPQCPRCGKSVYAAEQVIGPLSRPYHKPCLACTVCNKRLDSTLLAEHEGEAYCNNCHKAHLGQGKGGFGLAVPLRPEKPTALRSQTTGASTSSAGSSSRYGQQAQSAGSRTQDDDLAQELSGISIAPRRDNPPPVLRTGGAAETSSQGSRELPSPTRPRPNLSKPTTVAQSIDDLVASGYEVPIPYSRAGAGDAHKQELDHALYGETARRPLPTVPDQGEQGQRSDAAAPSALNDIDTSVRSPSPLRGSSRDTEFQRSLVSTTPTTSAGPSTPPPPQASRDTIGTVRFGEAERSAGDGLPPPTRKDPIALAREREKGLMGSGGSGMAKTYSPRTTPIASRSPPKPSRFDDANNGQDSPSRRYGADNASEADGYRYTPNSALNKMGLGSTVHAAAVGTPLCARCERPVYFAEQKQAASRKWHRACLRCDGCSTTLESGKLEEGPASATYQFPTNVWCRPCYAKRFGPKGIGVAGISLPEMSR